MKYFNIYIFIYNLHEDFLVRSVLGLGIANTGSGVGSGNGVLS